MHVTTTGFRYVARGSKIRWMHPAEMQQGDVDCTDMDDLELQRQVCRTIGIFKFGILPD